MRNYHANRSPSNYCDFNPNYIRLLITLSHQKLPIHLRETKVISHKINFIFAQPTGKYSLSAFHTISSCLVVFCFHLLFQVALLSRCSLFPGYFFPTMFHSDSDCFPYFLHLARYFALVSASLNISTVGYFHSDCFRNAVRQKRALTLKLPQAMLLSFAI